MQDPTAQENMTEFLLRVSNATGTKLVYFTSADVLVAIGFWVSTVLFLLMMKDLTNAIIVKEKRTAPRNDRSFLENALFCPLSLDIIRDPVILCCTDPSEKTYGHVYDKEMLCQSLLMYPNLCPKSNMRYKAPLYYVPCLVLQNFLKEHNLYKPYNDEHFKKAYFQSQRGTPFTVERDFFEPRRAEAIAWPLRRAQEDERGTGRRGGRNELQRNLDVRRRHHSRRLRAGNVQFLRQSGLMRLLGGCLFWSTQIDSNLNFELHHIDFFGRFRSQVCLGVIVAIIPTYVVLHFIPFSEFLSQSVDLFSSILSQEWRQPEIGGWSCGVCEKEDSCPKIIPLFLASSLLSFQLCLSLVTQILFAIVLPIPYIVLKIFKAKLL